MQQLSTWEKTRRLLITAGLCYVAHFVVAFATVMIDPFPWGAAQQAAAAHWTATWWLPALSFMADHYPEALLSALGVAGLGLWRGASLRTVLALLIGLSVLWWVAMVVLRFISTLPLGWHGAS